MAKKLALIDPDLLTNLLTQLKTSVQPQPPVNPTLREMGRLDNKMENILETSSEDARDTLGKYNNALQAFMVHNDKYKNTPIYPPVAIAKPDTEQVSEDRVDDRDTRANEILATIPKPYRAKAGLLLQHIKNNYSKIGWDSTGQVTVRGYPLPGTNIVDIVHDLVRPRKVNPPPGIYPAVAALKESNLPREAVGNKNRVHLFDKSFDTSLDKSIVASKPSGLPAIPETKKKRVISTPRKKLYATPYKRQQTVKRWLKFQ